MRSRFKPSCSPPVRVAMIALRCDQASFSAEPQNICCRTPGIVGPVSKSGGVTRSLAFAGVVALTLLQPAVTLAAPPGGMAVFRPAPMPAPVMVSPSRERWEPNRFRVPFGVDVHPKPLPGSREAPEIKWSPEMSWRQATQHRAWLPAQNPGYLWYQPAWLQPACSLNNAFAGPSSSPMTPPPDVTIGSLVDKNSENLFSMAPSHTAGLAAPNSGTAATSSALGLQYQFQATPCTAANSFNF